jgi:hypothetical protein
LSSWPSLAMLACLYLIDWNFHKIYVKFSWLCQFFFHHRNIWATHWSWRVHACWCQKNRQVSISVASSKKLEPENLDAITCSYKIVLCQACKFYHSWRQLWSHDIVVLLLVTCQKGKLLCLLWSFLLYWTFFLLWGHFHSPQPNFLGTS